MMHNPELVLCAEDGTPTGLALWHDAHASPGLLHRAFSIYIFRNNRSELLIQRRSAKKPLWPLQWWCNTCCSNTRVGETEEDAAPRRLQEECGFTCELIAAGSIYYQAEDPNGNGAEHEYVTLFVGDIDESIEPNPDPDEIAELQWISVEQLQKNMEDAPEQYAPWFLLGLKEVLH